MPDRETTFTTLRELKDWLSTLSDEDLDALTNVHDWYEINVTDSRSPGVKWKYYSIEGKEG